MDGRQVRNEWLMWGKVCDEMEKKSHRGILKVIWDGGDFPDISTIWSREFVRLGVKELQAAGKL